MLLRRCTIAALLWRSAISTLLARGRAIAALLAGRGTVPALLRGRTIAPLLPGRALPHRLLLPRKAAGTRRALLPGEAALLLAWEATGLLALQKM